MLTTAPDTAAPLPYEVIAVGREHTARSWRSVGRYPDLEHAVRGRVEDVLAQLAANGGWLLTTEHLVIGPGADGPATLHCCMTEIGADPSADKVPDPFELEATRDWLLAAHGLL